MHVADSYLREGPCLVPLQHCPSRSLRHATLIPVHGHGVLSMHFRDVASAAGNDSRIVLAMYYKGWPKPYIYGVYTVFTAGIIRNIPEGVN